jgi:hypothetical protein
MLLARVLHVRIACVAKRVRTVGILTEVVRVADMPNEKRTTQAQNQPRIYTPLWCPCPLHTSCITEATSETLVAE